MRLIAPGIQRVITIDLQRPGSVPWYAVTTWTETPQSDFYCVEPLLGLAYMDRAPGDHSSLYTTALPRK